MQRAANAEQLEQKTYLRFWTTLNLCRIPTKNLNCRIQGQKKFWWHLKWPCYYRLNLQYHKAWKITPPKFEKFCRQKIIFDFRGWNEFIDRVRRKIYRSNTVFFGYFQKFCPTQWCQCHHWRCLLSTKDSSFLECENMWIFTWWAYCSIENLLDFKHSWKILSIWGAEKKRRFSFLLINDSFPLPFAKG